MEWIQPIITLGSIVAAILAWVAKLRWSKEFTNAKDATIAAREAQIEQLKDAKEAVIAARDVQIEHLKDHIIELRQLSPPKIKEYMESTQQMLSNYNDQLQSDLDTANEEKEQLANEIQTLVPQKQVKHEDYDDLVEREALLQRRARELEDDQLIIISMMQDANEARAGLLLANQKLYQVNQEQQTKLEELQSDPRKIKMSIH